ncbi:RHS repeat-associated core domain-containing protein [Polaribacter cellanae]|uniref:RHS repeat-associated core domain-containing protein n=1 Tax=Polaribacter cellanae TaxID=2818493 RepID=A0A975CSI2_9FLAO|nr:RHS repeat-associated core domain-containing protein [Polaribacter cellanae]
MSLYPFGLKHRGYNNVTSSNGNSVAQKKLFNGKELQDELGLDWYDYGARNYDASLGRWMNIDPLADHPKQLHASPFAYTNNNPVLYIDPDGKLWIDNGDGTYTAEKGDSASTLHTQHLEEKGYTFEETNAMVEQQYSENRVEDGIEKSNIDPGDVVHEGKQVKSSTGLGDYYDTKDTGSDNNETPIVDKLPNPDAKDPKKAALIEIATMAMEQLNPINKIIKGALGKGGGSTRINRSSTRTTSSGTSTNANTSNTRTVNVKGHYRTLKSGKKVWVKPHTRTIKNKD